MLAYGAIKTIARRLSAIAGWQRWCLSLVLGVFAATAQPPHYFLPVLIIAFTGLAWVLDGSNSLKSTFYIGWMFGTGYFGAGLYWITYAFLVDPDRYAWLIPFAMLGLSLGLGLFGGCATLLAKALWSPGIGCALSLAASWTLLELIRGVILTGFPWNPIGNVWVVIPAVLQAAAWVGVYGLSAITIFAATCFSGLGAMSPRHSIFALSGFVFLFIIAVAGNLRVLDIPSQNVPNILLRIVQPNIAQQDKWQSDRIAKNYARHLQMSGSPGGSAVTHIIWPETATPFSITTDPVRRKLMESVIPQNGYLISGTIRFPKEDRRPLSVWNSLVAVDAGGSVAAVYDKHHLVPFGEYVPFRNLLPFKKLTEGIFDFSAGSGLKTLKLAHLPPFSPLICYEAIFPGRVALLKERPEWLLNVTNDAWFGQSAGPHQHFASAILRAVEEGLPLVRAANTGISAIVDPYGRVISRLGVGERGVIDGPLPKPISSLTLFAQFGNLLAVVIIILMMLGAFLVKKISEK